jgi:hypothetical protein
VGAEHATHLGPGILVICAISASSMPARGAMTIRVGRIALALLDQAGLSEWLWSTSNLDESTGAANCA